jgi:hypothetical protein
MSCGVERYTVAAACALCAQVGGATREARPSLGASAHGVVITRDKNCLYTVRFLGICELFEPYVGMLYLVRGVVWTLFSSLTVRKVILYGKGDFGGKFEHQIWFK